MARFNPEEHLIKVRGNDYLEVKWRLVWMREEHPDWSVRTELLDGGDIVVMKAAIHDAEGRLIASGHAEYPRGRQFPAVMKCETSAVGRALAMAGYGTQFAGEDVAEPDVVDAPVDRARSATRAGMERLLAEIAAADGRAELRAVRRKVLDVPPGTPEGDTLREAYKLRWEQTAPAVTAGEQTNGQAA